MPRTINYEEKKFRARQKGLGHIGKARERVCPFWITAAVEEVYRPEPRAVFVTHCMATGRMICPRDPYHYETCEYYQKFRRSKDENVDRTTTMPRFPVPSPD
ncbi:MAG: hypothetical protein ABH829_04305 [archaeon]